jgi:hypothetical protein
LDVVLRTQPYKPGVAVEPLRPVPLVPYVKDEYPEKDRVAARERISPGFAIAIPELDAISDPVHRAAPDPRPLHGERKIEPDDGVGLCHDEVPQLRVVVAVDDPAV